MPVSQVSVFGDRITYHGIPTRLLLGLEVAAMTHPDWPSKRVVDAVLVSLHRAAGGAARPTVPLGRWRAETRGDWRQVYAGARRRLSLRRW